MSKIQNHFIIFMICFLAGPVLCVRADNREFPLTAYACYNKAMSLEKTIPSYKAVGRVAMKDRRYSYNLITYVKNTAAGGHWVLREERDLKTARLIGFVFLENDEGQFFYNKTRIIKVSADFIGEDIFYVQYFRASLHEEGQFSYLQKAPDGNVIVVRTLAGEAADALAARISEKSSAILASLMNKKVKYPGVTDEADIVPVRASYRISIESGLIMEETYFNKAGAIISSPRKYDAIDVSAGLDANFFDIPSGRAIVFAKDAEGSWELIKRL
jgi:hypothetical protein